VCLKVDEHGRYPPLGAISENDHLGPLDFDASLAKYFAVLSYLNSVL